MGDRLDIFDTADGRVPRASWGASWGASSWGPLRRAAGILAFGCVLQVGADGRAADDVSSGVLLSPRPATAATTTTSAIPPTPTLGGTAGGGTRVAGAETESEASAVASMVRSLNDSRARPDDREEAARRLVAVRTPSANAAVRAALENAQNVGARLAAARGLADVPPGVTPDPSLVDPLLTMITPDAPRPLLTAVVDALGTYQADARVPERLADLAGPTRATAVRLAGIEGLGRFPSKRSAARLVTLLEDPDPAVTATAVSSLVQMTGRDDLANGADGWRGWWRVNVDRPDADLRADFLADRSVREARLSRRLSGLTGETRRLAAAQYRATPRDRQSAVLASMLANPEPAVRAAGAELVFEEVRTLGVVPDETRAKVRDLLLDSDAGVRRAAARAAGVTGDSQALAVLVRRATREPDAATRAAIAGAFGPLRDVRAIDPLLVLLRDSSADVATAAAVSLRDLGSQIRANPATASRVAETLRDVVTNRAEEPVRLAAVEAMVPLRQPTLVATVRDLLLANPPRGRTSPAMRRAALSAAREIADPVLSDRIVALLGDADASVRLEAVRALATSADGFTPYADLLYRRLDPAAEPDAAVRDEAWRALESLFPLAPKQQLATWPDKFRDQPRRRLEVLLALADAAERQGPPDELAVRRQQIGDTYMELREPDRAAPYYRESLDFQTSSGRSPMTVLALNGSLLRALVRSRDFDAATQFAQDLGRRDPSTQGDVGQTFRQEIERMLREGTDASLDDARRLLELVLAMRPPPREPIRSQLLTLEQDLRRRLAERERAAGPRSAWGQSPTTPVATR